MHIEFKMSAFRHKNSEADIRHAFMNPCYDGPIEENSKAYSMLSDAEVFFLAC